MIKGAVHSSWLCTSWPPLGIGNLLGVAVGVGAGLSPGLLPRQPTRSTWLSLWAKGKENWFSFGKAVSLFFFFFPPV